MAVIKLKKDPLLTDVQQAYELERQIKEAGEELSKLKHKIAMQMAEKELKRSEQIHPTQDGKYLRATYTSTARVKVDEEGLKTKLGAREFNKLTVRKFDRGLLDKALAESKLTRDEVSTFLTTEYSTGVRFYTVDPEEVESDG